MCKSLTELDKAVILQTMPDTSYLVMVYDKKGQLRELAELDFNIAQEEANNLLNYKPEYHEAIAYTNNGRYIFKITKGEKSVIKGH